MQNKIKTISIYIGILFFLTISNCCFIPKNKVDAPFHSYQINTNVDSEIAKYYLENYLQGERKNSQFDQLINDLNASYTKSIPSRDDLLEISKKTSIDFSALFFANRLLISKNNEKLQAEFLKNLDIVKKEKIFYKKDDFIILLVPGFDYVENGSVTGADFAKPRELLSSTGLKVHFVNIDPIGSVEENALFITDTIKKFPDKKILIAGASSAGPAIHLSLGQYLDRKDSKRIKAWLNLGGILQGVPLLDQFSHGLKGFLFDSIIWIKNWRKTSFESMQTEISRKRYIENQVPESIYILNYLGLSLSGDISKFASDKYCLMLKDGPNDGLSLLPDLLAPNSHSIISPKSDHFFAEDPEIDLKTLALLKTIIETVDK